MPRLVRQLIALTAVLGIYLVVSGCAGVSLCHTTSAAGVISTTTFTASSQPDKGAMGSITMYPHCGTIHNRGTLGE